METGQISDLPERPSINPAPSTQIFVRKLGITTLYDGARRDEEDTIVDIIFVHGLGGHPKTTWSSSKPPDSSTDQQTLSPGSKRRHWDWLRSKPHRQESATNAEGSTTQKHEIYWPADFLPAEFPGARILTWGYDSKVTNFFSGAVDQGSYHTHATNLLYDVKDARAAIGRKRPIIWFTHSLGGILVKKALLSAQLGLGDKSGLVKDICESTKAVFFLGTPHLGSPMADRGSIAEKFLKTVGFDTNPAILNQLSNLNPELTNLNEEFVTLYRNRDISITIFRETTGLAGIYGLNRKVVEDHSSGIAGERQRDLPGNHINMCKFSSKDDIGYDRVKAELLEVYNQIKDPADEIESTQAGRLDSDSLREPQFPVAGQLYRLVFVDSQKPDPLTHGDEYLSKAIEKGNELAVDKLLEKGEKTNEEFRELEWLKSDISKAIEKGNEPAVRELLEKGVKIDEGSWWVKSNLSQAISSGKVEIVELLLDYGANIENIWNVQSETPLMEAAKLKSHAIVKLLLQRGANPESMDDRGYPSLHIACECGDVEMIELLLQDRSNIEQKSSYNKETPLLVAARSGRCSIVDFLVRRGAVIEATNSKGMTPLHLASEFGHADVVSFLISKGAAVSVSDSDSCVTPLHLASENGHDAVVKVLIEAGADTTVTSWPCFEARTPLHLAAQNGHHEVVERLCFGPSIEMREKRGGNTALLLAALRGHTLTVKVLLEKKADVDARNNKGLMALNLALERGYEELALLLISEGASTEWPIIQLAADRGQTLVVRKLLELGTAVQNLEQHGLVLTTAASAGHTAIVSLLLSNKAMLDWQDSIGNTALHCASICGYIDTARLLLNNGANIEVGNNSGQTPLHLAVLRGHESIVELLISKGADCSSTDGKGFTPLHFAARFGHDNIMSLLINAGSAIDALGAGGVTPLGSACRFGKESTARALLEKGAKVAGPGIRSPLIGAVIGEHLGIIDILQGRNAKEAMSEVEALVIAASYGHASVIKKLMLWGGIDVNATWRAGGGPALHCAAAGGHNSAIQALLEEGAGVHRRSDAGYLPIYAAALNGHTSAIRSLLDAGSSVECLQSIFNENLLSLQRSDQDGLVRLFVQFARVTKQFYDIIKEGDIAKIREQATNTAVVNMRDGFGNTALHMAIQYNCIGAIPILCDAGVDIDIINFFGRTALLEAVIRRNLEAQRLLLQHRADANLLYSYGFTALHVAVITEQEASVKLLVETGIDINIKDNMHQKNALQYAEERGFEAVLPLLRKFIEGHSK